MVASRAKRFRWGIAVSGMVIFTAELAGLYIYGRIFLAHFHQHGFSPPSDLECFRTSAAVALGLYPPLSAAAYGVTPFMNPPPFLLFAAPLALVSPLLAYMLWNVFGIVAVSLAGRAAKLSWAAIAMGLVSPPGIYCLATGQTGDIMSGLLLLCLGLAETNPVIAGIAAGCTIVKPQFAILLPVCFLAGRNWRAIFAAGVTTFAICFLSILLFGLNAWEEFLYDGLPTAHALLVRPWPVASQGIMITVFVALRSLGVGLTLAFAVQFAVTAGAVAAAWYLWRPRSQVDPTTRILLTLCLMVLATPYGFIYDIPGIAIVLAAAVLRHKGQYLVQLAMFWLISALYILISMVSFAVGGILLLLFIVSLWPRTDATASDTVPWVNS